MTRRCTFSNFVKASPTKSVLCVSVDHEFCDAEEALEGQVRSVHVGVEVSFGRNAFVQSERDLFRRMHLWNLGHTKRHQCEAASVE